MRLTLINPPYTGWTPRHRHLVALIGASVPLGLLALAAYARAHLPGLAISVVDGPAQGLSAEGCVEAALATTPDVVGITMTTPAAGAAGALAAALKARLPHIYMIAGGPHISGLGLPAMEQAAAFDAAVLGEGEVPFLALLASRLPKAATLVAPPAGVILRLADGSLRAAADRPAALDLATTPLPAWDLLTDFPRAYPPNLFFSPAAPAATLVTSRGCPYTCAFCDQSTFGRHYRAMPAQRVFEALQLLVQRHGIRYVNFYDDLFTAHRLRIVEICRAIQSLPRRIYWSCDANVLTLDAEILGIMKAAGCWSIALGLESGDAGILRGLNKSADLERAREAVVRAHAVGISVKGLFICGTPEESAATAETTRRFIASLPLATLNLSKFTPYPGSSSYAPYAAQLDHGFDLLNGMNFVVPSRHLSIAQLEDQYSRTLRSFYRTAHAIRSHLPMLARPRAISRLIGFGAASLFSART